MTGWELGNCQRYGLDPIVVLFNNCSWKCCGCSSRIQVQQSVRLEFSRTIAPSLGGHGERVTTRKELRDALERAVARRGQFSLVEVMLKRGETSKTLERFVSGFKAVREKATAT